MLAYNASTASLTPSASSDCETDSSAEPAKPQQSRWLGFYRTLEDAAKFDITFFVACYNEEKNILATLENLRTTLQETRLTYEIIVVDDGSKDRSSELVEGFMQQHPEMAIRLFRNPRNRGLAYNFTEATFMGRGRYYKLVCGDNVDTKESLLACLNEIGRADIIVPYHAEIEGRSWFRRVLSRAFTNLVNLLSGHRIRYYNGCAIYHRSDVMRWHARTSGFGFQAELVTTLLNEGATFLQVPIVGMERQGGSSSALKLKNWVSISNTLCRIFVWRLRRIFGKKHPPVATPAPAAVRVYEPQQLSRSA